jgi:hypothetical protein
MQLEDGIHYKVVDDFLPQDHFDEIQNYVILNKNNMLGWTFVSNINTKHTDNDNNCYFEHLIYHQGPQSALYELFDPLWNMLQIKSLIRIKANCYPAKDTLVTHAAHKDAEFDHNGAILSLNDCDGYTQLLDGTKIESKANRLLIFNAGLDHSSTNCTDQKARFNININYF